MADENITRDGSSTTNLKYVTNGPEGSVWKVVSGVGAWVSTACISLAFNNNTGTTSFGFIGQIVNINAAFTIKDNSGAFTVTGNNQINNVSGRELSIIYDMNFCARAVTGVGLKVVYGVKVSGSQQTEESEGILVNNLNDLTEISMSCTLTIPIGGNVIFTVSNTTSTDSIIVETVNGFIKEV